MKTVSLKLPDVLAAKLTSAAKKRKASKSELMREALEAFFANGEGPWISCYDLAPHLAGCLDGGPSDLSTNKKYMEDFGR